MFNKCYIYFNSLLDGAEFHYDDLKANVRSDKLSVAEIAELFNKNQITKL